MQNVVVARPYRFVPPRDGALVPGLLRLWLPHYLRVGHGVVEVACRGVERLRASRAAGHGVMLAPNHCRPCDPMVLGVLAGQAGSLLYIMASWHLFAESRFRAWLLPRAGVFSIHREGLDREALKCAVRILVEGRRPLVVFPEGVISRHNDRLNHLMEGTALMARTAARQRAAAAAPGRVVIHPVAIRYLFDGGLADAVDPVLEAIERRLAWRPQRELPTLERVLKVGSAMLALKEIEYLGEPQPGGIAERTKRLIDRLLRPVEDEWLGGRHDEDVIQRVKLLRTAIVPDLVGGELPAAEQERRWRHLADVYLAQQVSCYPAGYFTPAPTPERILETVERFEEDMTDVASVHAPIRAVVEVGEAIEVEPGRRREEEGDPLMALLRERLTAMLAASLAEARPGARMA